MSAIDLNINDIDFNSSSNQAEHRSVAGSKKGKRSSGNKFALRPKVQFATTSHKLGSLTQLRDFCGDIAVYAEVRAEQDPNPETSPFSEIAESFKSFANYADAKSRDNLKGRESSHIESIVAATPSLKKVVNNLNKKRGLSSKDRDFIRNVIPSWNQGIQSLSALLRKDLDTVKGMTGNFAKRKVRELNGYLQKLNKVVSPEVSTQQSANSSTTIIKGYRAFTELCDTIRRNAITQRGRLRSFGNDGKHDIELWKKISEAFKRLGKCVITLEGKAVLNPMQDKFYGSLTQLTQELQEVVAKLAISPLTKKQKTSDFVDDVLNKWSSALNFLADQAEKSKNNEIKAARNAHEELDEDYVQYLDTALASIKRALSLLEEKPFIDDDGQIINAADNQIKDLCLGITEQIGELKGNDKGVNRWLDDISNAFKGLHVLITSKNDMMQSFFQRVDTDYANLPTYALKLENALKNLGSVDNQVISAFLKEVPTLWNQSVKTVENQLQEELDESSGVLVDSTTKQLNAIKLSYVLSDSEQVISFCNIIADQAKQLGSLSVNIKNAKAWKNIASAFAEIVDAVRFTDDLGRSTQHDQNAFDSIKKKSRLLKIVIRNLKKSTKNAKNLEFLDKVIPAWNRAIRGYIGKYEVQLAEIASLKKNSWEQRIIRETNASIEALTKCLL